MQCEIRYDIVTEKKWTREEVVVVFSIHHSLISSRSHGKHLKSLSGQWVLNGVWKKVKLSLS
jgi:hypothetical protein